MGLSNMDISREQFDKAVQEARLCPQISFTLAKVLGKLVNREEIGRKKYGATIDREDLSACDWITHAQEEAMDLILYLERLKDTLSNDNR